MVDPLSCANLDGAQSRNPFLTDHPGEKDDDQIDDDEDDDD